MTSTRRKSPLGYTQELVKPNCLRTHIPGIPCGAFDPWGKTILPWHLLQLFDSAESVTRSTVDTTDRIMVFEVFCRLEIDQSLYNVEAPKHPLIIDKEIQSIGRTSKCQIITLYHPDVKVPYVTLSDIDVNIDPETRRPKPYPEAWKTQFGVPSEPPNQLKKFHVTKPSIGVVKTEHKVHFSDTDENQHTNYSVYLKFAYNSFCENMLNNEYNKDVHHLFNGGVKVIEMTFKKESLLGDTVSVESWEDITHSDTYHFQLNKGEELCCFVTIQYYFCDNNASKL